MQHRGGEKPEAEADAAERHPVKGTVQVQGNAEGTVGTSSAYSSVSTAQFTAAFIIQLWLLCVKHTCWQSTAGALQKNTLGVFMFDQNQRAQHQKHSLAFCSHKKILREKQYFLICITAAWKLCAPRASGGEAGVSHYRWAPRWAVHRPAMTRMWFRLCNAEEEVGQRLQQQGHQ